VDVGWRGEEGRKRDPYVLGTPRRRRQAGARAGEGGRVKGIEEERE